MVPPAGYYTGTDNWCRLSVGSWVSVWISTRLQSQQNTLLNLCSCMSGQRQAVRPASSSSRRNNCSSLFNTGLASSTSRTSSSQAQGDPERHTVVIVSPRRRRRTKETSVSVVKKKDLNVWDLPDEEIIGLSSITLSLHHFIYFLNRCSCENMEITCV